MSRILLYTFENPRQITYKIAQLINFPNIEKFYIGDLKGLIKLVEVGKFDLILGLGDYRKDARKIKVEEIFKNRYGKQKISKSGLEFYRSTWKLIPQEGVCFSVNACNGPCNRSAYLISGIIQKNHLWAKLAFVHVPSEFPIDQLRKISEKWLKAVF